MPKLIKLDPQSLDDARQENIRGAEVQVYLSPYDIPQAVAGGYDDELHRFVIEFKYVGGRESLASIERDDQVTLKIGRYSGRLYRVEIDVKAIRAKVLGLSIHTPAELMAQVDKAIGELDRQPELTPRAGNYRIAKRVLAEKGGELFTGLPQ
ncbi:MAG TPA: hypothetical protein VK395_32465 [Gemmataceae bacterium]|nr:hypothetical protein [Gemmataceae bacterium]